MIKLLIIILYSIIFTNVSPCKKMEKRSYHPKIFGGNLVNSDEFLHHAGVGIHRKQVFCGGSIISNQYIISAAHCHYIYEQLYEGMDLGVIVGTKIINSGEGTWYKIKKVVLHPKWDPDIYEYDVLLLQTKNVIKIIPGFVEVVNLPEADNFIPHMNSRVWTCGWGLEAPKKRSEKLKKIDFHIASESDCKKLWGKAKEKRICVFSVKKGWGTCNGDSGAGLMYKKHIIGILSYGTEECDLNALEVYSDLHVYVNWIKGVIK